MPWALSSLLIPQTHKNCFRTYVNWVTFSSTFINLFHEISTWNLFDFRCEWKIRWNNFLPWNPQTIKTLNYLFFSDCPIGPISNIIALIWALFGYKKNYVKYSIENLITGWNIRIRQFPNVRTVENQLSTS